jgi:hypothetical protein
LTGSSTDRSIPATVIDPTFPPSTNVCRQKASRHGMSPVAASPYHKRSLQAPAATSINPTGGHCHPDQRPEHRLCALSRLVTWSRWAKARIPGWPGLCRPGISPHFRPRRHRLTAEEYRREMDTRFTAWNEITGTSTSCLSAAPEIDSTPNSGFTGTSAARSSPS